MRQSSITKAVTALEPYNCDDNQCALTDLLTDLMLWANVERISFDECLSSATDHFNNEKDC